MTSMPKLTIAGIAVISGVLAFSLGANQARVDAADSAVTHEFIDPVPSFAFTQAVSTTANGIKTVHVSGQIGAGDDHEAQTEAACRRILERLAKAGATQSDVVKLVVTWTRRPCKASKWGRTRSLQRSSNRPLAGSA